MTSSEWSTSSSTHSDHTTMVKGRSTVSSTRRVAMEAGTPLRELYAIEGEVAPTEAELKQQEDEVAHQQAVEAAANAERLRRVEKERRNLANRGRHVQEEILQTKMGDQNVFTTPQQNILITKVLYGTIEPM